MTTLSLRGHQVTNRLCFPALQFSNGGRDEGHEMVGWKGRKIRNNGHLYGHHAKIETHLNQCKYLKKLAPQAGLEPATRWLTVRFANIIVKLLNTINLMSTGSYPTVTYYIKCYWILLNIRTDRHQYEHLIIPLISKMERMTWLGTNRQKLY